MKILTSISEVRSEVVTKRNNGQVVGFVPTMGALHEGHLSLIRTCRKQCDYVVVSIFVNPAQFGPGEDLDSYPRTMDADCEMCKQAGVDLVFAPAVNEMYPQENLTWVKVDKLGDYLCGASRPTFFRGVCTVVTKLFNIVMPDVAYFGQKDAQQLAIIRRMVRDLNIPVEIRSCPIVRDENGLALSSRNKYLNSTQRKQALCLHESLQYAQEMIKQGQHDTQTIIAAMQEIINKQPEAKIDYISIVDTEYLQPVTTINGPVLIALAVYIGTTRLIDNTTVQSVLTK